MKGTLVFKFFKIKNMDLDLKKLRKQHGISQEYLAQKLGVSRPTYIQIEKGEKELTISQAKRLFELFGTSLGDVAEKIARRKKGSYIPIFHPKKFKEALLYILEKVGAKPNIGETALYKLLYFIDFDFYEKYGKPVFGATYIKNHHGPTPKQFKKMAEEMIIAKEIEPVRSKYFQYNQQKYLPLRAPDLTGFTVAEVKHIDEVLARLSDKNALELSNYSHGDVPWQAAENQKIMDYEGVFYRSAPYAQFDYDEMMQQASAQDVLAPLPPLTQEEYDYYMSLPDKND